MAPRDPAWQRMLQSLAREDGPQVIEEARAGARERARAVLEDALVDELLETMAQPQPRPAPRQAARQAPDLSPPAPHAAPAPRPARAPHPAPASAWWAYCVVESHRAAELAADLEGIEPGSPVEAVGEGELAALVSRVPLSEYGDEQLRLHLEDIAWLERTARAHEAVQERVMRQIPLVPLRLCTIYRDPEGVRAVLRENADLLTENLAALENCAEWGVKVFLDAHGARAVEDGVHAAEGGAHPVEGGARAVEDCARAVEDGAHAVEDGVRAKGAESTVPGGSGINYLAQRQRERDLAERADELCARCAEEVHHAVAALAEADRINPNQRPEAHGREGEMVLNGAYLVEHDRLLELQRTASDLHEEWAPQGLLVELTGPWPPYNFVSDSAGMIS